MDDDHYAALTGHTIVRATDTIDRPPTLQELEKKQAEKGRADAAFVGLQHARIHDWAEGGHGHCSHSRGTSSTSTSTSTSGGSGTSTSGSTDSRNRSGSETKSSGSSTYELKGMVQVSAEEKVGLNGAHIPSDERCDLLSPLLDVLSYIGSRSPSPGPRCGSGSTRSRASSVGSDVGEVHPAVTGNPAFFHGAIPRDLAEQRLLGTPPGSYLVREKKFDRIYALTLHVGSNRVQHHLIERSVRRDGSPGSHFVFNSHRLRDCHNVEQVLARIVSGHCKCAIALGKPVEHDRHQRDDRHHGSDSPHHHHHRHHRSSPQHYSYHQHQHFNGRMPSPQQSQLKPRQSRSHSRRRPSSVQERTVKPIEYGDHRQRQPQVRARRPRAATTAPTVEFCV